MSTSRTAHVNFTHCTCQLHALYMSTSCTVHVNFTHCTCQLHALHMSTSRTLRSGSDKILKIPKRNLKSFGDCSLSFVAASCLELVPASLRNVPTRSGFKSPLKTFSLHRPVQTAGQTMPVYVNGYIREGGVQARSVSVSQKDLCSVRAIYYRY